jgi:hypothetical protein
MFPENEDAMDKVLKYMEPKKSDKKNKNETIIIAPHPDDEIIGCYEVLKSGVKPIILFSPTTTQRENEALKLKEYVGIRAVFFCQNIPSDLLDKSNTFYFPNPVYETHPLHREKGMVGEILLRNGFDVIFYSTEMNYHAKYECKDPTGKRNLLNTIYPGQMDLWRYDYKYWLFSGYEKWVIL